jgi:hypothetical protein
MFAPGGLHKISILPNLHQRIHLSLSVWQNHLPLAPAEALVELAAPLLEMKRNLPALLVVVFLGYAVVAAGQSINDPARIEVYVTPYYNSKGPTIKVGPFSNGLGANTEPEFVATITRMKQSWDTLSFPETYVAAIRLYDLGFRKEAIYWFYSAQYRGRLLATLVDRDKMGSIGDPGFELVQAANAFQQLVGPYVNGYAFGDIDQLVPIIEKVQVEGKKLPDMNKIYPGVTFKNRSEWETDNKGLNEGLGKLVETLREQKASIKQQRIERGMEAKFSKLSSKELPKQTTQ